MVFALWDELEPDLSELDEYGGGDHETEDYVANLLYDLIEKLEQSNIPKDDRRALLDDVIHYIRSGNAGMDDNLYDVVYAVCKDDEDWRNLAERLEALGGEWPRDHARRIYRRIGDREKFLSLRATRMEYGADYHDLATFYWEEGEQERALAVAREGLEKAKGRMDELRTFMSDRAKETGDRRGYLELQFAQATSSMTLASYNAFEKLCQTEEWTEYEPRMVTALEGAWKDQQLKIHMYRKEFDKAVDILSDMAYPNCRFGEPEILNVAEELEKKYPERILKFYKSGLGNLNRSFQRKIYAQKAHAALNVRHIWLDVFKEPAKWEAFARQIKTANRKRPAFQEEFARVVPGWRDL
ncbi:MAG: hypothetical protein P9X24_06915 [Candidatus Hatepunaea meridiana]|nr:hypothetical protein [Candidatus Hatepunaea meridiana]